MPAHVVSDSGGTIYYLLTQEYGMSCGPASVAMVNSIYKQICMTDPEGDTRRISQLFPGAYNATSGTMMDNLTRILNTLSIKNGGVTSEASGTALFTNLRNNVTATRPAILHIDYGGGFLHFAVCVKATPTTVTMLDPWFGLQEIPGPNLPAIGAGCNSGAERCTPGQTRSGNFSLWVIYTQ